MKGRTARSALCLGLALVALIAVDACAPRIRPEGVPFAPAPKPGWVGRTLRKMTLEEKIGQLIAVRFSGVFRNEEDEELRAVEDLIVRKKVGAVIIFGGEVYETAHVLNRLQRLARYPLLVASDLERGTGNQITGATLFPPLMSLGAAGSEAVAREMGRVTAVEGRALGIHMTYAPVVDVNINPDNPIINTRAVGEDPELVSRIAAAFIAGVQGAGMIATAKHFPGHGDTSEDSHSLLPTITADRDRLEKVELYPFRRAIEAGVGAVMTAHLYVPALDPEPGLPATLSEPILSGVLRRRLGFKGLIVTDALEMRGITDSFPPEEAALRALRAGVDMLLLPLETEKVADSLVRAVREGRISEARINESVARVLRAKAGLGLHRERFVDIERISRVVGSLQARRSALEAFERSVTLVKNEGAVVPLAADRKIAVVSLSSDRGDYYAGRQFAAAVRRRAPAALELYADGDTGQESLDEALEAARRCDIVVVALFSRLSAGKGSVDLEPKHKAFVERLLGLEARPAVVAVSFGSPYFLRSFPGVDAYVCLYRNTPQTQEVAAAALFGELDVSGRLPVSLPGLFPFGHGLELKKIKQDR